MNLYYKSQWPALCLLTLSLVWGIPPAAHGSPPASADPALAVQTPQAPSAQAEELPPSAPNPEEKSLSLYQAEELALRHSPTLRSSRYSAMVTHEQLGQWLSNVYPSFSLSSGFNHSGTLQASRESTIVDPTTNQTIKVDSGGSTRSNSRFTVGLNVSQTLIDLTRKPRLRQAELAEVSALADLEAERQNVLLEVRRAWFTCYIDQTLWDIALEVVANRQVRLREAEEHYKTGLKARSEVVSAQADLAAAQHEAHKAQTQLLVDWVALNQAMGLFSDEPYRLELNPYWEQVGELDSERLVAVAMSQRPELLRLQAQLRSALAELDIINAEGWPTLRASGSLGANGALSPIEGTWSLGVSLNWSLFDGFMRQYQESAQKIRARALAEDFEAQRLSIYQEVKSAEVALRQSETSILSAEASLASAQEKYRLAAARYKVGVADSVEVSDAEVSLAQAQEEHAQALNTLRLAKAQMIKALGVDDMDRLPQDVQPITLDALPPMPDTLFNDGQKNPEYSFPRAGEER